MRTKLAREVSKLAGTLFIDYRFVTELTAVAAGTVAFLVAKGASNFPETLDEQARSTLYVSVAGTSAALLGFVLTALAILVALPSSERMDALRKHPKWPRVPSAYFRASRVLLLAVVLCILGIALDSARAPWVLWEAVTVAVLVWALVRVSATLVALAQLLAVASAPASSRAIQDPGP